MVHMKILGNATLALLGNLHNMQMSAAITDISFFDSNSVNIPRNGITRKPCYRKDDRTMRPMYKLFTLILFTLMATIGLLCADFDSERI